MSVEMIHAYIEGLMDLKQMESGSLDSDSSDLDEVPDVSEEDSEVLRKRMGL